MDKEDFAYNEFEQNEFEQNEYDQDWQSVQQYHALPVGYDADEYNSEYGEESSEDDENKAVKEKRKLSGFQRTVKYQLIICALAVIGVIAVKFTSADLYQTVKSWYYQQLNSQLFVSDVFNRISGNANEV
ncbi:hypothetical protein [Ruminococcus sp. zg-921]|uniref:hypothetical protein n=1 Tax=Ruminococcus sp. zg-921 TaxID=2678506 RepID=UPI00210E0904|nr:hypothetical protein [Ruminococcus sp. zg-921]MCQ4115077.1 hypothetical protein [Ruminococcus sp. zg-921]